MKILIADDERATREGLRAAVRRFFPQAEILPLAANGIEALDIISQILPDILISDIVMPGMDGLQLLETLYEKAYEMEFVIVSAYDNFEYAKRAMKLGVRHYILKPCKDQEIQSVIKQAMKDVKQRRNIHSYLEKQHEAVESFHPNAFLSFLRHSRCHIVKTDPGRDASDMIKDAFRSFRKRSW